MMLLLKLVPPVKPTNGLLEIQKPVLLSSPVPKLTKLTENVMLKNVTKLRMLKKNQMLTENVFALIPMNSKLVMLKPPLMLKKLIDVLKKLNVTQLVKPTKPVKVPPVNQKLLPPVLMPLPLKPDVTNVPKTEKFGNVPLVLTPPPSN